MILSGASTQAQKYQRISWYAAGEGVDVIALVDSLDMIYEACGVCVPSQP